MLRFINRPFEIHFFILEYVRSSNALNGTLRFHAEYFESSTDNPGPTLTGGGSSITGNRLFGGNDIDRDAGYLQLSYRPDKLDSVLGNTELVTRYDFVDQPDTGADGEPQQEDESRWTLGVNYWFNPSTAVKVAYQFDDHDDPAAEADQFLFQFVYGF